MFEQSNPMIRLRFGPDRTAARAARRTALLLTSSSSGGPASTKLGLVISELVMNVIDHTSGGGCLSLWMSRERCDVRVEVTDTSTHFPIVPREGFDPDQMHGLHVVNHYCPRWGVVQSAEGKTVWAELPDGVEPTTARAAGPIRVTSSRNIQRDLAAIPPGPGLHLNGCLIADVSEDVAELVLVGEFDLSELADITPTMIAIAEMPPPVVTIDLGGVSYIGAAGIRTIVGVAEAVRRRGGKFVVVGISRVVDAVIEATGCSHILGEEHRRRGFKPR